MHAVNDSESIEDLRNSKNNSFRLLRTSKKITFGLVLLAGGIFLSAWIWYDYRFPSWDEEVMLGDGRTLVIRQKRDEIRGRGTRRTWLTFSLLELGGERTWSEQLYPSLVGVSAGKVYVVGRPRGSTQFSIYKYPRYVYVAFVWEGNQFIRIPFMSVPEAIRGQENLRWCLPKGGSRYVSWTEKSGEWCDDEGGQFPLKRSIDLSIREKEAEYWAHLDGHKPASE